MDTNTRQDKANENFLHHHSHYRIGLYMFDLTFVTPDDLEGALQQCWQLVWYRDGVISGAWSHVYSVAKGDLKNHTDYDYKLFWSEKKCWGMLGDLASPWTK